MKAPGAPARGRGAVDTEAEYYQTIEESFVALRGDPLILSNADWLLVRRWRTRGYPLRIVLRGIRDALDAHAHSFDRQRPVRSLRYCEGEVEAALERWHRALGAGADGGDSAASRLRELSRRIAAGADLPPGLAPLARRAAETLAVRAEALASSSGDPEQLEAWLVRQEKTLVRAAVAALPGAERAALEGEIKRDLEPYRGRMPEVVLAQVREESLARRLLERWCLPRLTLYETM